MLIHFANPIRGKSLCGAEGDVRWIGGSFAKKDCCPSCWILRPRTFRIMKAVNMGPKDVKRLMDKDTRIAELRAAERDPGPPVKKQQEQLLLLLPKR